MIFTAIFMLFCDIEWYRYILFITLITKYIVLLYELLVKCSIFSYSVIKVQILQIKVNIKSWVSKLHE